MMANLMGLFADALSGRRRGTAGVMQDPDLERPVKWVPVAFDSHGEAFAWDIVYSDK